MKLDCFMYAHIVLIWSSLELYCSAAWLFSLERGMAGIWILEPSTPSPSATMLGRISVSGG